MTTAEEVTANLTENAPSTKSGRWSELIALGIFGIALFAYFSPLILASSALFYFDITELNYAYRHYFAENLKAGRISFWCHQLYNGLPLFAESQAGYFHPLKFLFYPWMSTWAALGYDMVGSLAITGLGTYVWLRRHAHPSGAIAGAFIATFGGFTWAHFVHTSMINALASVPWIIWGLERSWRTGRLSGAAVAAFALAFQVFAGHLQDAVFSVQLISLMTLYAFVVSKGSSDRRLVLIQGAVAVVFGILIASVQWGPSYDLLKRTPRTEGLTWHDQTFGSWHPQLLPTLFVREAYGTRARDTDWMDGFYPYHEMNAYVGASAMLLALIGARRWRDPWCGLWVFVVFVSAVLMLGRFTFVMDYWHRIPILGSSRIPVRYHQWTTFAIAALVSQGIDILIRDKGPIRLRGPLTILWLFALSAIGVFVWGMIPWWTEAGRWTSAYHLERNQWLTEDFLSATARSTACFAVAVATALFACRTVNPVRRSIAGMILAVVIGADLVGSHWWEMPTVDPSFWTKPPASVEVVKADPQTSRVMGIARYSAGEPGYASKPIDFFAPRDALGWSLPLAYGLESNVGETPFRPARLIRLTDLAGGETWRFGIEGVTHLVSGQPLSTTLKPISAGSAYVYRIPETEPRFHWAQNVMFVKDDVKAEAVMKQLGSKNAGDVLVVESDGFVESNGPDIGGSRIDGIVLKEYGGDRIGFELSRKSAGWLRLGVSYDPGWRAWLSGREIPVRHAQLAFMAVEIPPGDHQLELRYEPVHFRTGAIVALAIMVVLTLLVARWPGPGSVTGPMFRSESMTPKCFAPRWLAILLALSLVVSAIRVGADGSIGASQRWDNSWHRFTWGAGIEAMIRK